MKRARILFTIAALLGFGAVALAQVITSAVSLPNPLALGSVGGTTGQLNLLGSTSGTLGLVGSATGAHLHYTGGVAPTNNACTGFALGTGSTDLAGTITYTSATTCTFNFGTAFANAPFCVVTPATAASTVLATPSTSNLAITFGTAQTQFSYVCYGS